MNKLKVLFISLLTMFSVAALPVMVYAQADATTTPSSTKDALCQGVQFASGASTCDDAGAAKTVPKVVNLAIRLFQLVIGIISVFTIIGAGLGYVTSGGDAAKTKSSRERILYAAVGLMIVVIAEVIVRFVLNRVASVAG